MLNNDTTILDYQYIDSLNDDCKLLALDYYRLHDVEISNFYKITQKVGCDYNGDNYMDSIYILTPVNQVYYESDCFEKTEIDTSIILIFKNSSSKQKIFRIYKNLFCPIAPSLIYRELDFNNDMFTLTKDFGFGNGRKVYSNLHFSWKEDDFYADSIEIRTLENGIEKVVKETINKKLSKLKNIDCEYF